MLGEKSMNTIEGSEYVKSIRWREERTATKNAWQPIIYAVYEDSFLKIVRNLIYWLENQPRSIWISSRNQQFV